MSVEAKSKAAAKKSPVHPNTWVFHEGEFARYHDVRLGLMTHALHYGTGVFEGIRAYWNEKKEQLYLLQGAAHFDRMRRSENVMRMILPHSTEELVNFTLDLLRRIAERVLATLRFDSLRRLRLGLPLDAGIDVLRILTEDQC